VDSLYQIGKDIGVLQAQMTQFLTSTKGKCGCGEKSLKSTAHGTPKTAAELTGEESQNLKLLRQHHSAIQEAFDKVLAAAGLSGKLKLASFELVPADKAFDDDEPNCACCVGGCYRCCYCSDPCGPGC
jgi:hypothetical protein